LILVIKDKSGATLLTVLFIASFLIFSISSALLLVSRHYQMQKAATDYQKSYVQAVNVIETTYQVLGAALKEGTVDLNDDTWITYQTTYAVSIVLLDQSYVIKTTFSDRTLVGQLLFSSSEETYAVFETLPSTRDQIENPIFRPVSSLDFYTDDYYFNQPIEGIRTFDESFNYLRDQREAQRAGGTLNTNQWITQNTYYTGTVTLNNREFIVAEGKHVIINGDLIINNNQFARLSGTFIIRGSLLLNRNATGLFISGLYFIHQNVTALNNSTFGSENNLFIAYVGGNFNANNNLGLYGFIFADGSIQINSKRDPYVGGVYSFSSTPNAPLPDRIDLDYEMLESIGGSFLIVEGTDGQTDVLIFKKSYILDE